MALRARIRARRREVGLRPAELIKRMGYRNVNKALRRFERFYREGTTDDAWLCRLAAALQWDPDELRRENDAYRQRLHDEHVAWQKANFRPYIEVLFEWRGSLTIRWFARSLWIRPLPPTIAGGGRGEMRYIRRFVRLHYYSSRGECLSGRITGYRYFRRYGQSLDLTIKGQVIRIGNEPEPQGEVRIV